MPLSAARALTLRATLSRLVLALRAHDREQRAAEIIERLVCAGGVVEIGELEVAVSFPADELSARVERPMCTDWLLAIQACLNIVHDRTYERESPPTATGGPHA